MFRIRYLILWVGLGSGEHLLGRSLRSLLWQLLWQLRSQLQNWNDGWRVQMRLPGLGSGGEDGTVAYLKVINIMKLFKE